MALLPVRTAAALILGLTLALTGCGTKVLTTDEAEKQISASVEKETGTAPEDVSCADDVDAEVGKTSKCTVTIDGEDINVTVKITKVDGDNVEFDILPEG